MTRPCKMTAEQRLIKEVQSLANIINDAGRLLTDDTRDSIMDTLADVLADSEEFHKILSNPDTDVEKLEPIIKRMLKSKKK